MHPRQTAIRNGDMFYEGKPCKKGHTTRYASDSKCTLCAKINGKIRYATPEYKKHHTEWKMKRYHNNPVCRMKDLLSRTTRYFAKQVGSSKGGRDFVIIISKEKKGNSLLKVSKKTGEVLKELSLGKDKQPSYAVDEITGNIFLKTKTAIIVGYKF